jgi:hypothetical protein
LKNLRPHQKAILFAALLSIVGFAVPILGKFLLPLTYLNTLIHEMSHAIAGTLSGANIDQITVNADGSGATPMTGGSIWLIGPAGYIGAAIAGAAIIWFSRSERGARNTLRTLAVAMAIAMLLWVRGDFVGVIAGIAWTSGLLLAATGLKGMPLLFVAQFVGLQQCLNSVTAVYTLLNISLGSDTHSDAMIMQTRTHIPAAAWAFGWCALSLVLIVISLRRAWSAPAERQGATPG